MKQVMKTMSFTMLAVALMGPASLFAQEGKESKEKDKKDVEQIIITRKGNKDETIVVEVKGDKVTVNGKEVDKNYKSDDVNVVRTKIKDVFAFNGGHGATYFHDNDKVRQLFTSADENRAMLGVTTEKAEKGAEIEDVTKESGAEKAGLKKGDVITRINEDKIESPDDLSEAVKKHKPGDKVAVTFLRDKKEQKVTAELSKWKGFSAFSFGPGSNFNLDLGEMNFENFAPRVSVPRVRNFNGYGQNWAWSGGGPRLGLSVQDAEDGKGVNVLEVDEDGNAAKAGIKAEDVITEVDGKAVNGADELAKVMKENKEKTSVKVKLLRKGKTENVEIKIPRKLKTADL